MIWMFEDTHILITSSLIKMSILEPNSKLDVPVELGDVHWTQNPFYKYHCML